MLNSELYAYSQNDTDAENAQNMIRLVHTAAVVVTKMNEFGEWLYSWPVIGRLTDQTLYYYRRFKCYYSNMSCEPNYECYTLSCILNQTRETSYSLALYQEYIEQYNHLPYIHFNYYVGFVNSLKMVVQKIGPNYMIRETDQCTVRSLTVHDVHPSGVRFLAISYSHPEMDAPITIELPAGFYLTHNVLFSATFIRWWLEYNLPSDDYVFDGRYVLTLMDTQFQLVTLYDGQSIRLHAMSYTVLPEVAAVSPDIALDSAGDSCKSANPEYQFETIEKSDVPSETKPCRWLFW
jgi:hypothetical protein